MLAVILASEFSKCIMWDNPFPVPVIFFLMSLSSLSDFFLPWCKCLSFVCMLLCVCVWVRACVRACVCAGFLSYICSFELPCLFCCCTTCSKCGLVFLLSPISSFLVFLALDSAASFTWSKLGNVLISCSFAPVKTAPVLFPFCFGVCVCVCACVCVCMHLHVCMLVWE